ncbi:hypothetical protein DP73_11035 [Desulfosporosinus sp. HMP52]|uniref:response regulator transcription factor n=1 Tax=Desulfosporosinus sp. HMP52 TaxID=1487923 RepID=UPI00051F954F|nr:response regulator transcription factor [Desulfosporosinus sp. HMP52]KGK89100.1 hypothetical protein DP73_11035 [Desulfosporosinus sp. HMP52]
MLDNKICLLVADDDMRMRRAIKDLLQSNKYFVFEADNGQNTLDIFYANSGSIDLILLDVMMPQKDGFSVLTEIRESSLTPIIMLTAKEAECDQLKGLTNGADDYITKPFSSSLLIARIETVLRRTGKFQIQPIVFANLTIDTAKRAVYVKDNIICLTQREYDLLLHFAVHANMTLSREQLLNSVWNYIYEGDGRTVDTHVKQLRAKLTESCPYIKTVHGVGYRFEVE